MATILATIAVILCVFFALRYIIKEKRRGSKCVGCPYAQGCFTKACDRSHH